MIVEGRDYEHTLGLTGPGLEYRPGEAPAIARRVIAGEPFDVAEFSLSAAMVLADRGELHAKPIPVFPARAFFHSYLFVRQDSPLRSLADLAGKRIAMRDFGSTGAIWCRGLLSDSGQGWRDITWIVGKARFAPPPDALIETSEADPEQLLLDGRVDAFFSARVKDRRIRPLLPDPATAEAAWFAQSGIFPIIHTVVVSPDAPPGTARLAFDAYEAAKSRALRRRLGASMMPWAADAFHRATTVLGPDPLPYGLDVANRHSIDTLARHMAEQGLTQSPIGTDRLYAGWDV